MKRILTALLLLPLIASAATFCNTNTMELATAFPTRITWLSGAVTYSPTTNQCIAAGWRLVTAQQQPAAGWVVDEWYPTTTNQAVGLCKLWIERQHNVQAAEDAAITNAPSWTEALVQSAQIYRSVLGTYFGPGTYTNAAVTPESITSWVYQRRGTLTASNNTDVLLITRTSQVLRDYAGSTDAFHWRFVP